MAKVALAAAAKALKGGAGARAAGGVRSAGSLARSQGGHMMHSSDKFTRQMGSRLMRVRDEKVAQATEIGVNVMNKIFKGVGKIVGMLAKHSPALQQQMIVIGKSISLFLRPIGDLLARWLRPLAQWMIKVAMRWYQLFGARTGLEDDPEDKRKSLESQLETAKEMGDDFRVDRIQRMLDDLEVETKGFGQQMWDAFKDGFMILPNFATWIWDTFISPGFSPITNWFSNIWTEYFKPGFEPITNWFSKIWSEYFKPGFEPISTWFNDIWTFVKAAFNPFDDAWPEIEEKIMAPFKMFSDLFDNIWNNFIKPGFEPITKLFSKIWSEYFKPGFGPMSNWGSKVWDMISGAAGRIINAARSTANRLLGRGSDQNSSRAVGGTIQKTGLYQLHAGERVVTAGDVSRTSHEHSNRDITINNHISIKADVGSSMDISRLAKELARYSESELRRRISYV